MQRDNCSSPKRNKLAHSVSLAAPCRVQWRSPEYPKIVQGSYWDNGKNGSNYNGGYIGVIEGTMAKPSIACRLANPTAVFQNEPCIILEGVSFNKITYSTLSSRY